MLRAFRDSYERRPVSEDLEKRLDISTDTSERETERLLRERESKESVTEEQIRILRSVADLRKISKITRREVTSLQDLKKSDYRTIVRALFFADSMRLRSDNRPLCIRSEYEYGWQRSSKCANGKMYYLLSYEIAMIDIDGSASGLDSSLTEMSEQLGMNFHLYRTFEGFHVFVTDRKIDHRSGLASLLSERLGGDIYYVMFSLRNGFKVRLNRKSGRGEGRPAEKVKFIGLESREDPSIVSYLSLHDRLIDHHTKSEEPYPNLADLGEIENGI